MRATTNRFLDRLRSGEQQIGLFATMADPAFLELLGGSGLDWVLIDTEHSPIGVGDVVDRLRALHGSGVEPVVRPVWSDHAVIKRLLDAGARTLLIPSVGSAEEAARAVSYTRYPPDGVRGVSGTSRAARYGQDGGYLRRAADDLCVVAQVETVSGLDDLEAIATTPGIDAVFIGPSDLAASLGHLGESGHPQVQAAVDDAFARLAALGVRTGYLAMRPDEARRRLGDGIHMMGVATDTLVLHRGLAALGADLGVPLLPEGLR